MGQTFFLQCSIRTFSHLLVMVRCGVSSVVYASVMGGAFWPYWAQFPTVLCPMARGCLAKPPPP